MTANHAMALRVVWGTRLDDDTPAPDARELLEMCGLVEPGGHEILPDIVAGLHVPNIGKSPAGDLSPQPVRRPVDVDEEPRPRNVTTPPGLRDLPAPPAVSTRRATPPTTRTTKSTGPARAAVDQVEQLRKNAAAALTSSPAVPQTAKRRGKQPASEAVTTSRPPRQRKPIRHGTLAGYVEHSRRKEPIPPDDPCGCRAVGSAYHRDRAEKRKRAASAEPATPAPAGASPAALPARRLQPVLSPIEHGTVDGWQAHHDRGALLPCSACEGAVAPPPAAPPTSEPVRPAIDVKTLLARAQRSQDPAVARAAGRAIALLVRVQAAGVQALADGRLVARLTDMLTAVTDAEARAAARRSGRTG